MTAGTRRLLGEPGPEVDWSTREALGVVLAAHMALIFVGSIVIAAGGWEDPYPVVANFAAAVPFWIVGLATSWWVAGRRGGDAMAQLGLSFRPIDLPLGIVVGVVTQLVVIPVVYWPLLRVIGSDTAEVERLAKELADSAQGPVGVTLFVAMTCVFAPLVEEVVYRGVLQRGTGRTSALLGVLVASTVFGVVHLQPLQFVGLTIFGLAAGLLAWRTGRTGTAIVAHVAFNAATVVPLLWDR